MYNLEIAFLIIISIIIIFIGLIIIVRNINKSTTPIIERNQNEIIPIHTQIINRPNETPLRLNVRMLNYNQNRSLDNDTTSLEQEYDISNINRDIQESLNRQHIPMTPIQIFPVLSFLQALGIAAEQNDNILARIQLFPMQTSFDPKDSPGVIRSDPENVHDVEVNKAVLNIIKILDKKYDKSKNINNDIGRYITHRRDTKDIEIKPVTLSEFTESLSKLEKEDKPVIYFDITPIEAVSLAWQRSDDPGNNSNKNNIKEAIISAIIDPSHICSHGMVSSVIGALDGVDIIGNLDSISSTQITRAMVADMTGIYYKKILTEIAEDDNLDVAVRCNALENLSSENMDDISKKLSCHKLNTIDKERGMRILKSRVRTQLHDNLRKMYGEKYNPYIHDTDVFVDMID